MLIILGLSLSFAVFTLAGTIALSALHLPADFIRWLGLAALVVLGVALIAPPFERLLERPFSRIPQRAVRTDRGGFVLGLALGAVFVPCAGPVLAAITIAGTTGRIDRETILLTVSFAVGCAVPLLVFAFAGREVVSRVRAFQRRQRAIRIVSGAVMIVLAAGLAFNVTDLVQRYIPNYTDALAKQVESPVVGSVGNNAKRSAALSACEFAALRGGTGLTNCGAAPAFAGISAWLNTRGDQPLTLTKLTGKVILVDFWAYSCINCQRELAHVEGWYQRYARDGLIVVGVHTPEYAFEHVPANVVAGAQRLGLTFPIAIDNSAETWGAYNNNSWPASYLIDPSGIIRHVSIGEGDYSQQEAQIRQLLTNERPELKLPPPTELPDTTPSDPAQTPESYLGANRADNYEGDGSYRTGTRQFSPASPLDPNSFTLGGQWTITGQSITAGVGALLNLSYHAADVYLDVGGTGEMRVTTTSGTTTIAVSGAPNIYDMASTRGAVDGAVTISLTPGLTAYSFTFG